MDLTGWRHDVVREFIRTRSLAERALEQMSERDFFTSPGPETNPAAILVKHVAGNLRSRWTNFLTTDGEKPDRNRDLEFDLDAADTRVALMARWNAGWSTLIATLEGLTDDDFARTVTIRGEPHTVYQAIHRQLSHYAYHAGQIVLLARHYAGAKWTTLSVARGQSGVFNRSPSAYLGSSERNSSPT